MQADRKERALNGLCILLGFLALLCLGLSYGWSVFRGQFSEMFPSWTEGGLSLIFSGSMIFFGVGSFFSSWLGKRMKLEGVMLWGMAMVSAGFWGSSLVMPDRPGLSYAMVLVLYGCLCGTGIGVCYNAINSSIPRFFPGCKGTVSGILMMGYGSGALVLGTLAGRLMDLPDWGVRPVLRILSVALGLVLAVTAWCFGRKTRNLNCRKTGGSCQGQDGFTPRQVLKLPAFWVLQSRNILSYAACLAIIDDSAGIARTLGAAAGMGLLISVFNGLGRIPAGILCDRIGPVRTLRWGNLLTLLGAGVLAGAFLQPGQGILLAAFALLGLGYGFTPPVSVVINDEFFGTKHRAENYAFFSFTLAPASLLGPTLAGVLQGALNGGIWIRVILAVVYGAGALLLSAMLQKPKIEKIS